MKRQRGYYTKPNRTRKKRRVTAKKKSRPRTNVRTGGFTGLNKKYVDTYCKGFAITSPTDASGGEVDIFSVVGGEVQADHFTPCTLQSTETGRTSDEIRILSLQLKGTVTCAAQANQTEADIGTKIYMAIVLDTQTNGSRISSEEVFENPSALALNAASPLRDMQRTKRFTVVKSWELEFDNPSLTYDGTNIEQSGLIKSFDCYINMDIVQQWISSSYAISNINDNSLQFIAYTSSTALAPTIQFNARVRFVDTA